MSEKLEILEGEIAGGFVEEAEEAMGSAIPAEDEARVFLPPVAEEKPLKEDDFIIFFKEPYTFEHKVYKGVDLSGMKNLRAKDIWKINRMYRNAGNLGLLQEMDAEYTARVAAKASGLPIEFFEKMSLPDMIRIRTMVSDFFIPKD